MTILRLWNKRRGIDPEEQEEKFSVAQEEIKGWEYCLNCKSIWEIVYARLFMKSSKKKKGYNR